MNSYILAEQFFQYTLNTFVNFFVFSLLVEGVMWVFSIRSYRLRACLRLLPMLRLALEPLFWVLPASITIVNTSIFSCSHWLQRVLLEHLPETLQHDLSVYGLKTVGGILILIIPVSLVYAGMISGVLLSLYRFASLIVHGVSSVAELKRVRDRGIIDPRPIRNQKLLEYLKKRRIEIVASDEVEGPLAGWGNRIMIPEDLVYALSQQEFEAVISHELEHHRWHDTLLRLFSHTVAAVYWWVPMTKWLHKLEQEQEIASDLSVHQYGLDGFNLAAALLKTVKRRQQSRYQCAAFAREHTLLKRFQVVLDPYGMRKQNKMSAVIGVMILLGMLFALGCAIC